MIGVESLDRTVGELLERAAEPSSRRRRRRLRLAFVWPAIAGMATAAAVAGLFLFAATGRRPAAPQPSTLPPLPAPTHDVRALKPPITSVGPDLARWFSVFREPQARGDAASRRSLGLALAHDDRGLVEGGINRKLARRVTGSLGEPAVYVVPGDGYVCMTGAGCSDVAYAARGRLVGFAQGCDRVTIFALLPDYAQHVRIRMRDGSEVGDLPVRRNTLVVTRSSWPPAKAPAKIVWDGPRGNDATTLAGIAGVNCAAVPLMAPMPQLKQLDSNP